MCVCVFVCVFVYNLSNYWPIWYFFFYSIAKNDESNMGDKKWKTYVSAVSSAEGVRAAVVGPICLAAKPLVINKRVMYVCVFVCVFDLLFL